MKNYILFHN